MHYLRHFRIFLFSLMLIAGMFVGVKAGASSGDNVTGFAWSSNIGWISFNCTNIPDSCVPGGIIGGEEDDPGGTGDTGFNAPKSTPLAFLDTFRHSLRDIFDIAHPSPALAEGGGLFDTSSYGVSVDPASGILSGFAWSSNIGWISFDEVGGCPGGTSCTPRIDLDDGELHGWARVLAGNDSSGWDGWISLNCGNVGGSAACSSLLGGSNYKAIYDSSTGIISGFGWGDEIVGWMKFAGPTYSVVVDLDQPTVVLTVDDPEYCPTDPAPILGWNATDMVSCIASATNADPAFTGPVPLTGTVAVAPSSPETSYTLTCLDAAGEEYADSVTINYGSCGSSLVLSAESFASCTEGYKTDLTLYSPTETTYASCSAITSTPSGTPITFTGVPNASNGYLVTIPDVYVPANPTTFSVTCTEPLAAGATTAASTTATTSVAQYCEAPSCSFTEAYISGTPLKATLTWESTGATTLTASGGWSGTKAATGTQTGVSFSPPSKTYTLTATSAGGTSMCSATLDKACGDPNTSDPNGEDCDIKATVSLTASPSAITLPDGITSSSTTLTWNTTDIEPDSCVGYSWPSSPSWNGDRADDGSLTVSISTSTTYRVQCVDAYSGDFVSDDAVVTIDGIPPPPPPPPCTDPLECRTKPWFIER